VSGTCECVQVGVVSSVPSCLLSSVSFMVTTKFLVGLAKMFLLGLLYLGNNSALIQIIQITQVTHYYVYPVYSQKTSWSVVYSKYYQITRLPSVTHYYVYPVYSQKTSWSVVYLLLHYIKE
jgi:hypothetical protein